MSSPPIYVRVHGSSPPLRAGVQGGGAIKAGGEVSAPLMEAESATTGGGIGGATTGEGKRWQHWGR